MRREFKSFLSIGRARSQVPLQIAPKQPFLDRQNRLWTGSGARTFIHFQLSAHHSSRPGFQSRPLQTTMSSQTSAPLAAAVGASPNLTLDEAGAIALGLFGLRASRVSSLGSCQDANFRIRVAVQPAAGTGADAATSGGKPRTVSFVLKVSNVAFAEPELDLQNLAMQHLSQRLHEQTQLAAPEHAAAFAAALRVPRPLRRVRAVWPEEAEGTAVANGIVLKSRYDCRGWFCILGSVPGIGSLSLMLFCLCVWIEFTFALTNSHILLIFTQLYRMRPHSRHSASGALPDVCGWRNSVRDCLPGTADAAPNRAPGRPRRPGLAGAWRRTVFSVFSVFNHISLVHRLSASNYQIQVSLSVCLLFVTACIAFIRFPAFAQDFTHPAADRHLQFDLRHAPAVLAAFRRDVACPHQRARLDRAAARAWRIVARCAPRMRVQVIHADLAHYNLVATPAANGSHQHVTHDFNGVALPGGAGTDTAIISSEPTPSSDSSSSAAVCLPSGDSRSAALLAPRVTGIIDFGDVVRSWAAADVATAVAALLVRDAQCDRFGSSGDSANDSGGSGSACGGSGRHAVLVDACAVVAGYHAVTPLNDAEVRAIVRFLSRYFLRFFGRFLGPIFFRFLPSIPNFKYDSFSLPLHRIRW